MQEVQYMQSLRYAYKWHLSGMFLNIY